MLLWLTVIPLTYALLLILKVFVRTTCSGPAPYSMQPWQALTLLNNNRGTSILGNVSIKSQEHWMIYIMNRKQRDGSGGNI